MTAHGAEQDAETRHCPWCAAHVPDGAAIHCPACGAALTEASFASSTGGPEPLSAADDEFPSALDILAERQTGGSPGGEHAAEGILSKAAGIAAMATPVGPALLVAGALEAAAQALRGGESPPPPATSPTAPARLPEPGQGTPGDPWRDLPPATTDSLPEDV